MVEAEVVAADGGDVVRLAGVGMGVVPGQQDAMPLEVGDGDIGGDVGEVLGSAVRG